VPQDINPNPSTNSASVGDESPKETKPPTPNAEETVQEPSKPPSLDGARNSSGAGGALTLPTRAAPSANPAGTSSGPEPTESSRTSPMSPLSYGLGAIGGYHHGEGSSMPLPEKPSRPYSRVVESLFDNPKFIQSGFHIGWFVTVVVDTEADRTNTKALYSALETASTHLDVSLSCLTPSLYSHGTTVTSLMQLLVKHSEAKDQFLRVAAKRMTETQLFEDELKEVSQLNSVLLAQKLELEAKLAEERQAKDGKHSTDSLLS
jgi:hypothetical protein